MNIVKLLKKQKENGKEIVMANGDIISKDEISKSNLKSYLAGIKDGSIKPDVSLAAYSEENSNDQVSVDELIDFIEGKDSEEE